MADTFDQLREGLARSLLEKPAHLPGSIRRAAAKGEGVPPEAIELVRTVHDHAYRTTDDHIHDLKRQGWSDDHLFELIVCAAFGAATRRLESGLRALEEASHAAEKG